MRKCVICLSIVIFFFSVFSGCSDSSVITTVDLQYGVLPGTDYIPVETKDAGIDNEVTNRNFGTNDVAWLGWGSPSSFRTVLKFDLSGIIPSNATVISASLTIYSGQVEGGGVNAGVYQLTQSWTEGASTEVLHVNVSWDYYDGSGNSWTTPGGDYSAEAKSDTVAVNNTGSWAFTLNKTMVQDWVDDSGSNYGVTIKDVNESGDDHWVEISTKEKAATAERPKLTVTYSTP